MANKLGFRFVLWASVAGLFGSALLVAPQPVTAQERSSREGGDRWDRFRGRGGDSDRGYGPGGYGGGGRDRSRSDGDRRDGDRDRDKDKHSDSKSSDSKSTTSSGSGSTSEPKPDAAAEMAKTRTWAEAIVREKDKDKNGWLNGDEIKQLSSSAAKADADGDKAITVDELVANAMKSAAAASATPVPSSGSDSSHHQGDKKSGTDKAQRVLYGSITGPGGVAKEGDKRRTYRFTPSTQKLPTGLPSWFSSKDANHDGQVSMSEYGKSWTERTVADFQKIDVNNDGVITPKEATKSGSGG